MHGLMRTDDDDNEQMKADDVSTVLIGSEVLAPTQGLSDAEREDVTDGEGEFGRATCR